MQGGPHQLTMSVDGGYSFDGRLTSSSCHHTRHVWPVAPPGSETTTSRRVPLELVLDFTASLLAKGTTTGPTPNQPLMPERPRDCQVDRYIARCHQEKTLSDRRSAASGITRSCSVVQFGPCVGDSSGEGGFQPAVQSWPHASFGDGLHRLLARSRVSPQSFPRRGAHSRAISPERRTCVPPGFQKTRRLCFA